MLALGFGHWDYWELRHNVTFDGVERLIRINEGVTSIDVQRDIYSAWKEWVSLEQNARYLQALNTVGGEPTVAGQRLDTTYFLINGWRLKPQPGSYTLNIIGNLFEVDGGDIFVPADVNELFPNNININTNTSVIVRRIDSQDTTSGLEQDERDALFNIEDRVLNIENRFESPITAVLESSQGDTLEELRTKIDELWKIHGLDSTEDVAISKDGRIVGNITQAFTETNGVVVINRE